MGGNTMVPALSIKELQEEVNKKYQFGERRIIGIMLARYDVSLIKNVISECYEYWHRNSGKEFDVFWAGYGKYISPDDQSDSKVILEFHGNNTRVYFDLDEFITFKNEFKRKKSIIYKDKFEILLVNYYDGNIHFDEHIRIDLEKNLDENYASIREIMEFITDECKTEYNVTTLGRKMKCKDVWEHIKGIKISDLINVAIGLI
jgi:hypothetical protein